MNISKFISTCVQENGLVKIANMEIFLSLYRRLLSAFEFENVDDTVDVLQMKMSLLNHGSVCVFENDGVLRNIGFGGLSDKLDFYGYGTSYLGSTLGGHTFDVPLENGVVGWLDEMRIPLLPMIIYYSNMLAEFDTSTIISAKNTRQTAILTATSDSVKESMQKALDDSYNGKPSVYVNKDTLKQALMEGVQSPVIDLTGSKGDAQYIPMILQAYDNVLARVCREMGINISNVMKRAQVIDAEINGYENYTQIGLSDIEDSLQKFISEVNDRFGREWKFSLNKAFKDDSPVSDFKDAEKDAEKDSEKDAEKDAEKGGIENE